MSAYSNIFVPSGAAAEEEELHQVQPVSGSVKHSLSPPAKNTFDFPTVLECMSAQPVSTNMPHQDIFEDVPDDDDFDAVTYLLGDVESGRAKSLVPATKISNDQCKSHSTNKEIEEALLRDDYGDDNTISAIPYSFEALIQEAKIYYEDRKPSFCINMPEEHIKTVKLTNGSETEINLRVWSHKHAYWTMTDTISDSYIIKCFHSKYYVWGGVEEGFAKKHMATVLRPPVGTQQAHLRTPTEVEKDFRSISLRERTPRQFRPYTMYNTQKKYDDKGVRLTETELEQEVNMNSSPLSLKKRHRSRKRKVDTPHTPDSNNDERTVSTRSGTRFSSISRDDVLSNTILRTRFHGFNLATIPLPAETCASNAEFFEIIKRKWAFKLTNDVLEYCVASFPWLDAEKNVLLQESDKEGFNSVIEEIRRAPEWATMSRVEVIVDLYIELKLLE